MSRTLSPSYLHLFFYAFLPRVTLGGGGARYSVNVLSYVVPLADPMHAHSGPFICCCLHISPGACLSVHLKQVMAGFAAVALPNDVNGEYTQFFRELGITDLQKTSYLARLLEEFYELGAKLDEHLAPTGAVLHAAVSRMCRGENPMDPPHHRWIRIHDRLGFFADQDDHESRIINIGLSFAYRHKELDALPEANALRLEQLRLDGVRRQDPTKLARLSPGADEVPDGGRVVRNEGPASVLGPSSDQVAVRSYPTGAGVALTLKDKSGDDCGGFTVPNGGLEVRSDPPAHAAAKGAPADQSGQDLPEMGGAVVARRLAGSPAADPGAMTEFLMVTPGMPTTTHFKEQPLIIPSPQAVECTTAVLEAFLGRRDAKGVLRQLLVDGLLCRGRLHSGQTAEAAAGVISAAGVDTEWPAVRNLLTMCWPAWSAPVKNVAMIPPEGSVSRQTHPGRQMLTSRWKVKEDTTAINPTISRLEVAVDRNFKKGALDSFTEVQRMAPNVKVPLSVTIALAVTIASLLLVATWDSAFCTVMQQLAASGRAPVHRKVPIAAAACHDCESAGIGQPKSPGSTMEAGAAAASDGDATAPSTTAAPLAVILDQRQAEVDHLLEVNKTETAEANRARRIAARRRDRLSARPPTAGIALVPGSSPATTSAGRSRKRPAPRGSNGGSRKQVAAKRATGGPVVGGTPSMSRLTAAPNSTLHDEPSAPHTQASIAGDGGRKPAASGCASRASPDREQAVSVSPACLSSSNPNFPDSSLSLLPPVVGSLDGAGAQLSGSGTPRPSSSPFPRREDLERVGTSVRAATQIAEALMAVRFSSGGPMLSATVANPAFSLDAPFHSDSDADVAMMDEEADEDADADG